MDTPITLLDILQQHQVTTFMAAAIVLVVIIFCAWFFNRRIQKHDALIAKPLCLTADQEKQVSVRHHHKPRKIVFAIPAAFATNETIHAWAEQVAPRLGERLLALRGQDHSAEVLPHLEACSHLHQVGEYPMKNPFRRKPPMPSNRYVLGEEVIHPGKYVSIPRSAHLAILGESNSGKGSVIANIIKQEVIMGGEIWFIDLKAGMEAANYESVLDRKAYTLDEAEELLSAFNADVDSVAAEWRGKTRNLDDSQVRHRLLVIDEAADMIKSGPNKKKSDSCIEMVRSALSRSRALNCTMVVSTQNPRVSTSLPYRSLLLTTLALRLNSKSEAVMALDEDAVQRGARPWSISFNRPGDGYLWDTETNSVRFLHVPFVTDEEIHSLRRVGGDGDGRSGSGSPVPATPSPSEYRGLLRRPPVEM